VDDSLTLDITRPTAREKFVKNLVLPLLRRMISNYRTRLETDLEIFETRFAALMEECAGEIEPQVR
jgi:hypothetical protein